MKKSIYMVLTMIIAVLLVACANGANDTNQISGAEAKNRIADELKGELQGEITVSCYDAVICEKFLREAAELFELEHPGVKINVEVFSKMPEIKTMDLGDGSVVSVMESNDSQEAADYIRRINTQLMAGQGPDILAMDVLPYYKYAESGLLDDLRLYMEADEGFESAAYHNNIIESVRYQGGQYLMPLDFSYEFVTFDKNRVSNDAALALRQKNKFSRIFQNK